MVFGFELRFSGTGGWFSLDLGHLRFCFSVFWPGPDAEWPGLLYLDADWKGLRSIQFKFPPPELYTR